MVRAGIGTEQVVAAAAELADTEGLQTLTLTRVAEMLAVRPPSLYAHVDGLDDLLRRVGARGATDLATMLGHAVEGRAGSDALRALATAYRDFARLHPGTYAALQRSEALAEDPDAQQAAQAVVRVALAALRDYNLEGDEAIHAVRLIRITLHGYASLEAAGGFAMNVALDETFERLLTMLDLSLRSWPAHMSRPSATSRGRRR